MTYDIVLLCDGNATPIASIKNVFETVGNKVGANFNLSACPVGVTAIRDFGSPLPEKTLNQVKSAHAVLLGAISPDYTEAVCTGLAKALNLHTRISHISKLCSVPTKTESGDFDFYTVSDAFGGIYDGEKGFRTNPKFGREAYDTECYSELEIERVARIAYELADVDGASDPLGYYGELGVRRKLNLIDKADRLATSKLWRKIVTDVNEDYPQIHVQMLDLNGAIALILDSHVNISQDVLLSTHSFADVLECVAIRRFNCEPTALPTAYVGDTALGVYGTAETYAMNPIGILQAISQMLHHSFNMGNIANQIIQALSSLDLTEYKPADDIFNMVTNL